MMRNPSPPDNVGASLVVRDEVRHLAVVYPKNNFPNKVLHDLISHNIEIIDKEEEEDLPGDDLDEQHLVEDKEDNILQNIENAYVQADVSSKFGLKDQKMNGKKGLEKQQPARVLQKKAMTMKANK